jgi:predicted permease
MLEAVVQDVRIAVRILRKSPVFTATAALSLAIGIGANTAIFSLVNALLFKSRPGITGSDRLVDVGRTQRGRGFDTTSYPNYVDLRDGVTSLSGLAAYRIEPVPMGLRDPSSERGDAERVYLMTVSENFFTVLGTRPIVGRLFARGDDAAGRVQPTIVLSHAFWDRKYQRDPAIVGRAVIVNGVETTVVGVAEPGFHGTTFISPDGWVPVGSHPVFNPARGPGPDMLSGRQYVWLVLVGRLKEGASLSETQAQLATIGSQLAASYPESNKGMNWTASPSGLVPVPARGPLRAFLALLVAIVGLVLMIACINLAGVLLARGAHRRREVALRLAVGAGRGRLIRQLVTETLLIFAIGCAGGLLLSYWLTGLLAAAPAGLPFPVALDLGPDPLVVLFAAALTLVSGVLSGLVPALQAARTDLVSALKDEAGGVLLRRLRLRGALLVGQIALSCLLFLSAALLTRSLAAASRIDPGFDPAGVDLIALDLTMGGHRGSAGLDFAERLLARVRGIAGVVDASLTRVVPLSGTGMGLGGLYLPGRRSEHDLLEADWNVVADRYFETLRIPIVRGRAFTAADREGAPRVAIVNETLAQAAWPGEDPIGQRLVNTDGPDEDVELVVVGVTRNGKYRSVGEDPRGFIFVPFAQRFDARVSLVVRSASGGSVTPAVRRAVHELDPNLPLIRAERLEDAIGIGLYPQRVAARLAAALGFIGLLLAALGIYGVTAFSVAQRTREIGVRVALGAARGQVLRLVLRHGLRLAIIGVGVGLALGFAVSRLLSSLLVGLSANDPLTFAGVALVFCGIAALASYVPARAALRIDPLRALRVD